MLCVISVLLFDSSCEMELSLIIERILGFVWRASWQASVLVVLVLVAQWLCGRRLAPKWRYALWLLVVVRMMLPVTPPSPWSLFNYAPIEQFNATEADWWFRSEMEPMIAQSPVSAPAETQSETAPKDPLAREAPTTGSARPSVPAPQSTLGTTAVVLRQNLGWIWFGGVLVLTMRLAWGNYLFSLQLRRRHRIDDPAVLALFDECRQMMGLRRSLALLEAPELDGPALFGCFRLKLLLPEKMISAFSRSELRHIFLHELAHIRRWDAAVNWLTTILQTLHWFNPVLWFAFHRMRADREMACDELALARANEAESKPYGQTIIKVLEGFTGPTAIPGLVGILEDKSQIKRRIQMIAQFKKTARWPVMSIPLLIALGLISLTDAKSKKGAEQLAEKYRNGNPSRSSLSGVNPAIVREVWPGGEAASGSISADGKRLAFVDWESGNLVLRNLSPGENRRLTQDGSWNSPQQYAETCAFSRDGKQIAYSWYGTNGLCELRITAIERPQPRSLVTMPANAWITAEDWSPDGDSIAVAIAENEGTGSVSIIDTRDSSVGMIGKLEGRVQAMSFSPEGRYLAYARARSWTGLRQQPTDIYLLELKTGKETLVVEQIANEQFVGWMPNGAGIIFTSQPGGKTDLFALQVEDGQPKGFPKLVKPDLGEIRPIGVTRNGSLFYSSGESGRGTLYDAAIDFSTGKLLSPPKELPNRFTISKSIRPKALSPDGQFLAFAYTSSGKARMGIQHLRSGHFQEVFVPNIQEYGWPRWATDSQHFWVRGSTVDARAALYFVNRATGEANSFTPFAEPFAYGGPHGFNDATARYSIYRPGEKRITFVWHDVKSGTDRTEEARNIPELPNPHVSWRDYRQFMPASDGKAIFYIQPRLVAPGVTNWIAFRRDLSTGEDFQFFKSVDRFVFHHDPQTDGKGHSRPDLPILLRTWNSDGSANIIGIEISGNSAREWCSITGRGPLWPWWVGSERRFVMNVQLAGKPGMEIWSVSGHERGELKKSKVLPFMPIVGTYGENRIVFEKIEPSFNGVWVMENFLPATTSALNQ